MGIMFALSIIEYFRHEEQSDLRIMSGATCNASRYHKPDGKGFVLCQFRLLAVVAFFLARRDRILFY